MKIDGINRLATTPCSGDITVALKAEARPSKIWLPTERMLSSEKVWANDTVAAWKNSSQPPPEFALVVLESGAISSRVTTESLEAQWLGCQQLNVEVGDDACAVLHNVNQALMNSRCDWVGMIDAGCELAPDALFRVAQMLRGHPEWRLIYTDEDTLTIEGEYVNPHFKPDFNLEYLRSLPYVGMFMLIRRDLFVGLEGYDIRAAGAEDYDLLLRAWEYLKSKGSEGGIGHVSRVLYHRLSEARHNSIPIADALLNVQDVLHRHFERLGIDVAIEQGELPTTSHIHYRHSEHPLVTVIIPTRNQRILLDRCVQSLFAQSDWKNFEIIIVDNGSDEEDSIQFLAGLRALGNEMDGRIRIMDYPKPFNYSEMNNLAAKEARGEYLLLLNNDTAALHPNWLSEMMSHAQHNDVGAVGAKLLFPDGRVQHAGVILGMKGPAEHPFIGHDPKSPGYFGRLQVAQEYSAVTGACLLVRKSLFDEVGGLSADDLAVSYSDIDLCLKLRKLGKRVIWTPFAILLHEGSKSQNDNIETLEGNKKKERFSREQDVMYQRWLPQMAVDPAYNQNLSLASTEFEFEPDVALRWDPSWRPAPRIITHAADRMGCGEYRIIAPTRALINSGRIQGVEAERIYSPPELARIHPDSLVLQRQLELHQIEAIAQHKRFNQVFCVFEIDDLITNLPIKNAHRANLIKDIYKRLRKAVALCDRLVVATESLADAYQGLSDDIRVIPNFIERARWDGYSPGRRVGTKPRVGWAGGVSHTGDLEMIAGVVEALRDEVEWVFLGMCPERLRPYVHEFHEPVSLDDYPARLASLNLDLAIAPLEDVPFNHAKSHLRLLEYGVLGYPVICSDMTPYQGAFPVTRVRNKFKEWVGAIREHVADMDATAKQGDALRKYVLDYWLLEHNLDAWMHSWLP